MFLRYKSWLVIRPGLDLGGITGGWTTPLTGSIIGSFLGGGRFTSLAVAVPPPEASADKVFLLFSTTLLALDPEAFAELEPAEPEFEPDKIGLFEGCDGVIEIGVEPWALFDRAEDDGVDRGGDGSEKAKTSTGSDPLDLTSDILTIFDVFFCYGCFENSFQIMLFYIQTCKE